MQNKRCFLCGHKMAENGLCTNAECIRSQAISENENSENDVSSDAPKMPVMQAESGESA